MPVPAAGSFPNALDLTTLATLKQWLGIPNGELTGFSSLAGGSSYGIIPPTVTVSGASQGSGAVVVATLTGGVVSALSIMSAGTSYNSPGNVVFGVGGGGSGASATAIFAPIESQNDPFLARLITAVSNFIAKYLGLKNLLSGTYTNEVYDGHGGYRLFLRNRPITAVSSVLVNGISIPSNGGNPLQAGYTFTDSFIDLIGSSTSPSTFSGGATAYAFTWGLSNVQVSYTAGYQNTDDLMAALEEAALEICARAWRSRSHIDLRASSALGRPIAIDPSALSPRAIEILQAYKSVIPV